MLSLIATAAPIGGNSMILPYATPRLLFVQSRFIVIARFRNVSAVYLHRGAFCTEAFLGP
jgi:hypothetical protein